MNDVAPAELGFSLIGFYKDAAPTALVLARFWRSSCRAPIPACELERFCEDSLMPKPGLYSDCMRSILSILFSAALCGCGSLPQTMSAFDRFHSEHPNATILTMTKCEVFDPANTPAHGVTHWFADFVFVYRDSDGSKHEEIWHYSHSIHGWYFVKKERK